MCKIEGKANICNNGTVLIGKYLSCDGFDEERTAGAITHFHGDHISQLESGLQFYEEIFTSKATRDMLIAIKGDWLKYRGNLKAVSYMNPFDYRDEKITFYPVVHTLGSAQILVESNSCRILYTGDFREGTSPIEVDILVIDSTYGSPAFNKTYPRDCAIKTLVSEVKERLRVGSVCIKANRGKLQESMNILYKADLKVPFLFHKKVVRISKVYKDYGIEIGEFIQIGTEEAEEILRRKQPHIAFYPRGSKVHAEEIYIILIISDWDTTKPIRSKIADKEYIIGLTDHCEFNGLIEFVKQCRPKLVITDAYRCGNAEIFARNIEKRLNIEAKAMP